MNICDKYFLESTNNRTDRTAEITVNGGKLVMFTSCAFHAQPSISITDNKNVKFINCYAADGESVGA